MAATMALATSGCGSSTDVPDPPKIEDIVFASSLGIDLSLMTKTGSGLYFRDLTVGTGSGATVGKTISVRYNGFLADGTQFDAGVLSSRIIGASGLIQGFDEGLRGMAVSGIRQIIIPPALGYGANGQGPIPGNAFIVFRLEMLSIQ